MNFQATVSAQGGSPPYTFKFTSNPDPGLSIDPVTGVISGTLTLASVDARGAYTPGIAHDILVTDSLNATATGTLVLFVLKNPTLVCGDTSHGGGTLQQAVNVLAEVGVTLFLSCGAQDGVFSRLAIPQTVSGSLPPGTSVLFGSAPTAAGLYTPTLQVTDDYGFTAQSSFTVQVLPAVAVSPATLPVATAGAPYSFQVHLSGGTGNIRYFPLFVPYGPPPPGISINTVDSSTLSITGTPPAAGQFTVNLTLNDGVGITNIPLSLTVNPALSLGPLQSDLSVGRQAVATALVSSGGSGPITYLVQSGSLPPGVMMSSSGVFSGAPTTAGIYNFVVLGTDASGATATLNAVLPVAGAPITWMPLPRARVGLPYDQPVQLAGGFPPYTTLQASNGILQYRNSRVISGGPVTGSHGSTATVSLSISDSRPGAIASTLTQTVPIDNPQVATGSVLPTAMIQVPYQAGVPVPLGTAPFLFAATGLPPGVTFYPEDGVFTGTPTLPGLYSIGVTVTDATNVQTAFTYSLAVAGNAPISVAPTIPSATEGVPYSQSLTISGGLPPYQITQNSAGAALPLAISTQGVISFTPAPGTAGTYNLALSLSDATGRSGLFPVSLVIQPGAVITQALPLAIGMLSLANLTVGTPPCIPACQVLAGGGVQPYSFSVSSGALPSGLFLSAAGVLTGTPTVAGDYRFVLAVSDASGTTVQSSYTTVVAPPLQILTKTLPPQVVGQSYQISLQVAGGTAPYSFRIVDGSFPGSALSSSGILSGIAPLASSYSFTVQVTDSTAAVAMQNYTVQVTDPVPQISAVTSAASYQQNGVAPGEIVAIFGKNLGPATLTSTQLVHGGTAVDTKASATSVLFDGVPAPVIYAWDTQLSAVVPVGLVPGTDTVIQVANGTQTSPNIRVPVVASHPGIFTLDASGAGPVAAINQDYTINGPQHPAAPGSIVAFYATGGGLTVPPGIDGELVPGIRRLAKVVLVKINNELADVLYSGAAPGLVNGALQINARIPQDCPSGVVTLTIQVDTNSSAGATTVYIR